MFKCYDSAKLRNEILKCDQCNAPFNEYDEPRFLPCLKTICTLCMFLIESEAIKKTFKCALCLKDHSIPDDKFPLNEKIDALIKSELIEISRGKEYEQLQLNLNQLESLEKSLIFDLNNGIEIIQEYFMEQIRLIQLSTENKIEQLNKLNDELIASLKEHEKQYIQSFINRSDSIRNAMNKVIFETDVFLKEKQAYIQQYKIDDEEMNKFNKSCKDLQSALKKEKSKLISFLFENKLIKFRNNSKDIDRSALGQIDYEFLTIRSPKKLFSGSSDGTIKLWDLESNKCIKTFSSNALKSGVLSILKLDRNMLISGTFEGLLKILDTETGDCLKIINAHTKRIQKIIMLSNDKFITCSFDKTIKLFDLNTYECIRTFIGHQDQVHGIEKLSNDRIVSCSRDKTIRLWDLNSGECLKVFQSHSKGVSSIKIFSDVKIISGSENEIKIWDVHTGECLLTLVGSTGFIKDIVPLSDENFVTCDQSGKIIIWNIVSGDCLNIIKAHPIKINKIIKLSDKILTSCSRDKTIKVWDIENGFCLKTLEGHGGQIFCLEYF